MFYAFILVTIAVSIGVAGIVLAIIDIQQFGYSLHVTLLSILAAMLILAIWVGNPNWFVGPDFLPNVSWRINKMKRRRAIRRPVGEDGKRKRRNALITQGNLMRRLSASSLHAKNVLIHGLSVPSMKVQSSLRRLQPTRLCSERRTLSSREIDSPYVNHREIQIQKSEVLVYDREPPPGVLRSVKYNLANRAEFQIENDHLRDEGKRYCQSLTDNSSSDLDRHELSAPAIFVYENDSTDNSDQQIDIEISCSAQEDRSLSDHQQPTESSSSVLTNSRNRTECSNLQPLTDSIVDLTMIGKNRTEIPEKRVRTGATEKQCTEDQMVVMQQQQYYFPIEPSDLAEENENVEIILDAFTLGLEREIIV